MIANWPPNAEASHRKKEGAIAAPMAVPISNIKTVALAFFTILATSQW
jgi:hypothetical protein